MASGQINPLSSPKGVKYLCELCGKVAYLQCANCRVTYYCSKEHQSLDAEGIHDKICAMLVPFRVPPPILGTEEERSRREYETLQSQRALLELTKTEAAKFMHQGKHELAIPPALQSLRSSVDIFGPGTIEVVPAYLLLSEACTGLGRYKQAETYLSHAKWSVLKQPQCSNALKSQLHRNFGKLYAAQGKHSEAVQQLANDVYYCSLVSGPESINAAAGYFYLAEVFLEERQVTSAMALHSRVALIWHRFLTRLLTDDVYAEKNGLDGAQAAEALKILTKIRRTRQDQLGQANARTAHACYILGLLWHYFDEQTKAQDLVEEAQSILQDIGAEYSDQEHPVLRTIKAGLDAIVSSQINSTAA